MLPVPFVHNSQGSRDQLVLFNALTSLGDPDHPLAYTLTTHCEVAEKEPQTMG